MTELIGKLVEVNANNITYTGKLMEIGEDDISLEAKAGWMVIPLDRITSIIKKMEKKD